MDWALLAEKRDIGGWIEIIMIVLVVGGSALAPIAKKLITFFGGAKDEDRSPNSPSSRPGQPVRKAPNRPVARPMPTRPAQRRPPPPRPVAKPLKRDPERAAVRPPAKPPVQKAAKAAMAELSGTLGPLMEALGVPLPSKPTTPPKRRVQGSQPASREPMKARRTSKTSSGKPTKRRRKPAKKEEPFEHLVDFRHLHDEAAPSEKTREASTRTSVLRLNRSALRQAIVMNEILCPPLALRPPGEDNLSI